MFELTVSASSNFKRTRFKTPCYLEYQFKNNIIFRVFLLMERSVLFLSSSSRQNSWLAIYKIIKTKLVNYLYLASEFNKKWLQNRLIDPRYGVMDPLLLLKAPVFGNYLKVLYISVKLKILMSHFLTLSMAKYNFIYSLLPCSIRSC